jgi:hypothetical protein
MNGKTDRFPQKPHDRRKPTRSGLESGVWNPKERCLFVPKVFAWHYGVNLYELLRACAS